MGDAVVIGIKRSLVFLPALSLTWAMPQVCAAQERAPRFESAGCPFARTDSAPQFKRPSVLPVPRKSRRVAAKPGTLVRVFDEGRKMRVGISILLCLAAFPSACLAPQRLQTRFLDRSVTLSGVAYRYKVYVPASYSATLRWPIILFLHGSGERGSDGVLQITSGLGPAIRRAPSSYPAIVVFPQAPAESSWVGVPSQVALAALDQTLTEFSTDPDRVYLTGLSLGGTGTWYVAYRYPERFAAIAPICGRVVAVPTVRSSRSAVPVDSASPYVALARHVGRLPTWIFHGEIDPVVPVAQSRQPAEALRSAGGNVRYTEFLGMEHNVWDAVYASPQFVEWLFAQRRRR